MKLLARENKEVQEKLFHHLDTLLSVQIVPSDLALSLKEVSLRLFFLNNAMFIYVTQCRMSGSPLHAVDALMKLTLSARVWKDVRIRIKSGVKLLLYRQLAMGL